MIRHAVPSLIVLFLLFLSGCYRPGPKEAMTDLHQLVGVWDSKQVRYFESWEKLSDTLMKGTGYSLQGEDTAFRKDMYIFYEEEHVILSLKQDDERSFKSFKLTEAGRHRWVFENKTNEYPNVVVYEQSGDELETVMMNSRGNRKIVFNMKRK